MVHQVCSSVPDAIPFSANIIPSSEMKRRTRWGGTLENFRSEQVGTKCLPGLSFNGPQVVLELVIPPPFRMDLMIPYLTLGLRVIHIQALSSVSGKWPPRSYFRG